MESLIIRNSSSLPFVYLGDRSDHTNLMILLSDGMPTIDTNRTIPEAEALKEANITVREFSLLLILRMIFMHYKAKYIFRS